MSLRNIDRRLNEQNQVGRKEKYVTALWSLAILSQFNERDSVRSPYMLSTCMTDYNILLRYIETGEKKSKIEFYVNI